MKDWRQRLLILLCLCGAIFVMLFSTPANLALLISTASSLQDVAALIFGVIGIWLGLFYTNSFGEIFSGNPKKGALEALASKSDARALVFAMLFAGVAVALNTLVIFFAPFIDSLKESLNEMAISKGIGLIVYIAFTLLFYCLACALVPLARILQIHYFKSADADLQKQFRRENGNTDEPS